MENTQSKISSKKYSPSDIEKKIYDFWVENNLFEPITKKTTKKPFSIILPPPNVTGHLHLGHAWDSYIQDSIIRYKKICGYNTIFIPGTDHAGISAQTKFEKIAKEQNIVFKNNDDFLQKLKIWVENQKLTIHQQWKKIGLCLSYKNECFTLDENVNQLIFKEFKLLYKNKLIYRANKLVNWDVKLNSAISDIEVIYKETKSKLYYFKYFLENEDGFIPIATTRPETMFGDTNIVIAINSSKYKKYLGKKVINPINGEKITIIEDSDVEDNFGTGAMKLTPAHDFVDNKIAHKHNITKFNSVIEHNGKLNGYAKTKYADFSNIDRIEARPLIVADLKKRGFLIKEEEYTNNVGYSERTNEIVEPLLSLQWFVKMEPIVKQLRLLEKNKIVFFPARFKKTLNTWLDNIQDWCISRQLKWGHTIPVWYNNKTNKIFVGENAPKDKNNYTKEKDVLDTWFSSGLWPLATTVYAKNSKQLKKFYPIDLLVTGYDILFFWVARMLMQCCYIDNSISLKNIYLHGLIRDVHGNKMSKSLGNGIDPMDVIDKYGSDSLRLFFLSSSTAGDDLLFNEEKIIYCWKFINKLWNLDNLITNDNKTIDFQNLNLYNSWVIAKFNEFVKQYKIEFDKYNFTVLFKKTITFVWDVFCNTYVENRVISDNDGETQRTMNFLYKKILILLYPLIPFVTEYLYSKNFNTTIVNETLPSNIKIKKQDYSAIDISLEIISFFKDYRIKNNISKKNPINTKIELFENEIDKEKLELILKKQNIIISDENFTSTIVLNSCKIHFNNKQKKDDIIKKIVFLKNEIKRSESILKNQKFLANASKEKIKIEQDKYKKYLIQLKEISL